jgi:hypothetical protein
MHALSIGSIFSFSPYNTEETAVCSVQMMLINVDARQHLINLVQVKYYSRWFMVSINAKGLGQTWAFTTPRHHLGLDHHKLDPKDTIHMSNLTFLMAANVANAGTKGSAVASTMLDSVCNPYRHSCPKTLVGPLSIVHRCSLFLEAWLCDQL